MHSILHHLKTTTRKKLGQNSKMKNINIYISQKILIMIIMNVLKTHYSDSNNFSDKLLGKAFR